MTVIEATFILLYYYPYSGVNYFVNYLLIGVSSALSGFIICNQAALNSQNRIFFGFKSNGEVKVRKLPP